MTLTELYNFEMAVGRLITHARLTTPKYRQADLEDILTDLDRKLLTLWDSMPDDPADPAIAPNRLYRAHPLHT